MDDSKIIDLFFERSEQAITELSDKYGKSCKKIAFNILGEEADVNECINDAYLGLWNKIPPERPQPLSAYVFKVVRNLAIKKFHSNTAAKRNSFYDTSLDELTDCLPSHINVETEFDINSLTEEINLFLSQAQKENRIAFIKRYWMGESIEDIAKSLCTSSRNISVRLSRTRKALKKYLSEKGFNI